MFEQPDPNTYAKKTRKTFFVFFILLIVLAIFTAAVVFTYFYIQEQVKKPFVSTEQKNELFVVEKGSSMRTVAENLENQKLVSNKYFFMIYSIMNGQQSKIIAGKYMLNTDMSVSEISSILTRGLIIPEVVDITFPEGMNIMEYEKILQNAGFNIKLTDYKISQFSASYEFLKYAPQDDSLEGYLFPDTYKFNKFEHNYNNIIIKLLDNFDAKLSPYLRNEIKDQGRTIVDVIKLASIIEKEVRPDASNADKDMRLVAGILLKRIEIGMPLQVDATVNYALKKSTLELTAEDLKVDSLYNTYLYKGLPRGPISNPGLAAITAAIHPEASDYLYYLSKPDGTTVFSKTFEEHVANKNLYLK